MSDIATLLHHKTLAQVHTGAHSARIAETMTALQILRSGKKMLQLEAEELVRALSGCTLRGSWSECCAHPLHAQQSRHKSHAAIVKRRRILAGSQFRQFDADGDG